MKAGYTLHLMEINEKPYKIIVSNYHGSNQYIEWQLNEKEWLEDDVVDKYTDVGVWHIKYKYK